MTLHERLTIRPAMVNDLDVLTEFSAAMALETEHRRLDKTRLRAGTQAVIERPEHGRAERVRPAGLAPERRLSTDAPTD